MRCRKLRIFTLILFVILLVYTKDGAFAAPNVSSTSSKLTDKTLQRYNLIPQEIRDAFEAKGWQIIITDSATLNARSNINMVIPDGYTLAGTTCVNAKTIYLNDLAYLSYESVCHEMGHFFDVALSSEVNNGERASRSQSFKDIWKQEKNNYGDSYCASNTAEFFADCFATYIQNGELLKEKCPCTYNYVGNMINAYCASKAQSCCDGNVYIYDGIDYTSEFNPAVYYNRYPDLQAAFAYDEAVLLRHYAVYGKGEGRSAR
ncbi:MAG: hypothetical protein K6A23_09665 [Butyrivibrio sp.]|nr:hypothetical protein [Butyrivibrio sp.]